jgi:hypothetical protein
MVKNFANQKWRCERERAKRARLAKFYKHRREDAANEKPAKRPRRPRGCYWGKIIVRSVTAARWKKEGGKRIRNTVVVSR